MKCNWTKSLLLLPLLSAGSLYAQATFNTTEHLNINRFNIGHNLHGDMWYDATTYENACEYPKGTGKHATHLGGIWTTASDGSGKNDYAAALSTGPGGSDFWPGPLDATDTCTYASSEAWARIWRVNQTDIVHFRTLSSRTVATVPASILEWPAKGNPYAKGNAGASLSISEDMAPFTDVDGDGLYDPIKGDYPKIKGDQMLWWIINDNGATPHVGSKGTAIKLEYRVSAYAYNRGGKLDNAVFYEFDMLNKSGIDYIDFRMGLLVGVDMNYPFDDYIASDSAHRMGIGYDGAPSTGSYLLGLSLVEQPGDVYPDAMLPAGAFSSVGSMIIGPWRYPRSPEDLSNHMHGKNVDGGPLGYYPYKIGGPYEFELRNGTMCDAKEPLQNRMFQLSSNGFDFPAGQRKKVAMVLHATDTAENGCGSLNIKALTDVTDSAWLVYYNPLPELSTKDIAALDRQLNIYPNPVASVLMIDSYTGRSLKAAQLKIYDLAGREVQMPVEQNNRQISIDVSALSAGVYSLVYSDGEVQATQQFVKQ